MARRAGSLAMQRPDYSDAGLFPPGRLRVPEPFVRIEDFEFTAHAGLLPPTRAMVDLIEPRSTATATLERTRAAMLEIELAECTTARGCSDDEPAGGRFRMAVLWRRLAVISPDAAQAERATAVAQTLYFEGERTLLLERDAQFAPFGYRYGWAATAILEAFAESIGYCDVAAAAWRRAGALHEQHAEIAGRHESRVHRQMASIAAAKVVAITATMHRISANTGETVVSLRGRRSVGEHVGG